MKKGFITNMNDLRTMIKMSLICSSFIYTVVTSTPTHYIEHEISLKLVS